MPDESEPTITEVVSYKTVAKLFTNKQEPRIIKTWEYDNQVWVAWSHTYVTILFFNFTQVLFNTTYYSTLLFKTTDLGMGI